jgi:hypothetical protein
VHQNKSFAPARYPQFARRNPLQSELAGIGAGRKKQQVAMKPDESLSPSLFTFHSHFAAIHHL